MRGWIFALLLVVAPTVTHAQDANPPTVDRTAIERALSSFEGGPGPSFWQQQDPSAVGELVRLYDDGNQPPFVRLRAVNAARYFPSPASRAFLVAVADARQQPALFVREAIRSLSFAFGAAAVTEIEKLASHRESVVREAVVDALANAHSSRSVECLRQRLRLEPVPYIRARLRRALGQ